MKSQGANAPTGQTNPNVKPGTPPAGPQGPIRDRRVRTRQANQLVQDTQPDEFLAAHGAPMTMDSFNTRVEKTVAAYHRSYKKDPSPGLVWDIAKALRPIDDAIHILFDVPQDKGKAVQAAAILQQQQDGKVNTNRPDGNTDPHNMFKDAVRKLPVHSSSEWDKVASEFSGPAGPKGPVGNTGVKPDFPTFKQFQEAHKGRYGMIPTAFIPVDLPGGKSYLDIWRASGAAQKYVEFVQKHGNEKFGTTNISMAQATQITGSSNSPNYVPQPAVLVQMGLLKPDPSSPSGYNPHDLYVAQTKYLEAAKQGDLAKNITTVKQVQDKLKEEYPQEFKDLPSTGYFTQQWIQAYANFAKTRKYGEASLKIMAQQNNIPTDAKSITQMVEAWKWRQYVLSNPTTGTLAEYQIISSLPLRFWFDHQNFKGDMVLHPEKFMSAVWSYVNNAPWTPGGMVQRVFNTATVGFDLLGGVWNQGKAYIAEDTGLLAGEISSEIMKGHGITRDEAVALARKRLEASPTWMEILSGGQYNPQSGTMGALNQLSNFMVDLAVGKMMASPNFKSVEIGKAMDSPGIMGMSKLAYNALRKGDLRQAGRDLEAGKFGSEFVSRTAKLVRQGNMTYDEFRQHVANLYDHGKTTIGDKEVSGDVFPSYRSDYIQKPGKLGVARKQLLRHVHNSELEVERWSLKAKNSGVLKPLSGVERFLRSVRFHVQRTVPSSFEWSSQYAPDRVYHVASQIMPEDEATRLTNQFYHAWAHDNVARVQQIGAKLERVYREKRPLPPGTNEPALFEPVLETEGLTRVRLPKGGIRGKYVPKDDKLSKASEDAAAAAAEGVTPGLGTAVAGAAHAFTLQSLHDFDSFMQSLKDLNDSLLTPLAITWQRVTLITSMMNFWKHAIRDMGAAWGGGFSPRFRWSQGVQDSMAEATQFMKLNSAEYRLYANARNIAVNSEMHYLAGDYWVDGGGASWDLQDFWNADRNERTARVLGAAQHVRRMLTSDAYHAYLLSTPNDLGPLADAIMENEGLKAAFWKKRGVVGKIKSDVKGLREQGISGDQLSLLNEDTSAKEFTSQSRQVHEAYKQARLIFNRYRKLDREAEKAGGSLQDMVDIIYGKPGLSDTDLAKYIRENQINVHVEDGTLTSRGWFDRGTSWIIQKYMTPNRFWRRQLFDTTFAHMYKMLRDNGRDESAAIEGALATTHAVIRLHMLDYVDQLEFEQRYRWAIPFFTKHRLYTGWILRLMKQYPAVPLAVADVHKNVDQYGNFDFNLMGVPLKIPIMRLLWLNNDFPWTIPAAAFIPGLHGLAGTESSWFRLHDEAVALITAVKNPSYAAVMKMNITPSAKHEIQREIVSFGINYQAQHPGSPVPESEAVRYALLMYAAKGTETSLGPLPVVFASSTLPSKIEKGLNTYQKLSYENPGKGAQYLRDHPEVGYGLGIYKDPRVYWHTQQMYTELAKIEKERKAAEQPLINAVLSGRTLTPQELQQFTAIKKKYGRQYEKLLVMDAETWKTPAAGFPAGKVIHGKIAVPGPFGTINTGSYGTSIQLWLERHFPNLRKDQLNKVFSNDQVGMQNFVTELKQHPGVIPDPTERKTVVADIEQYLSQFRNLPNDPGSRALDSYFANRSKFWSRRHKITTALKAASGLEKLNLENQLRQMDSESMINGGKFTFDGKTITGPAFALTSWVDKTPVQQQTDFFQYLIGRPYGELDSADKWILGLNSNPQLDEAWALYNTVTTQYRLRMEAKLQSPAKGYLQYYAGWVNKIAVKNGVTGFMQDWLNTQRPKYQMILQYAPLQKSQYSDDWKNLLDIVSVTYSQMKSRGYSYTKISDYWRTSVVPGLLNYIDQNTPKGFQQELALAGGQTFVDSLVDNGAYSG